MVEKFVFIGVIAGLLAGCAEEYSQPIKLTPHGDAVRTNLSAQIINPIPPGDVVKPTDAARSTLAIEAYRTREIADPAENQTTSKTTDVD